MPSKKSKPTAIPNSRSNLAPTFFELDTSGLATLVSEWAYEIKDAHRRKRPLPRIALIGPMGAGKSTTARILLDLLTISRESEGSPTFAIAHEYGTREGLRVVHADGYRLTSEAELEATGLLEPLWDPTILWLFEWLDSFPEVMTALSKSDLPYWEVRFKFTSVESRRRVSVFKSSRV